MASGFLSKILERKRREVEEAASKVPEAALRSRAENVRNRRPFLKRLSAAGPFRANIIAEVKRASPSKGPIRPDLDAEAYASACQRGGAAALSVLTDRDFFQGSAEDLGRARAAVSLPVLRKDFLISTYQIYESAAMGADAVLLIVRALSIELLRDCLELCRDIQLDALVEVHSEAELETASRTGAKLIGINSRDLTTFQTDLQRSIRIARSLDPGQIGVAESGIRNRADIETLNEAGIFNFLIGESIVRAPDPEIFLVHLLGKQSLMGLWDTRDHGE